MGNIALGMAVAYLLILLASATGALLVLVWLFRNKPDTDERIGRDTCRSLRSAERPISESTSSAQAEYEPSENKAA